MSVALEFRDVDILFGGQAGRKNRHAIASAQRLLDAGSGRAEIQSQTGVVLGVAGANLSVRAGEICVLMGLSGSGKSTLLRAANRLNPVSRGQVLISDPSGPIDVAACDSATLQRLRRTRIAMVFQQFALLPWRSVRDNVGFGLELQGLAAKERQPRVDAQLALVGLTDWADRQVGELSGGMQQRVGLARAFATDADILMMDEPFSALDPLIRDRLQNELLDLQIKLKKTILFVSHDLDEALKLGDHIAILQDGRIIQAGTAEDIILRPANAYISDFVRHMNPLTALTAAMAMRPLQTLELCDGGVWLDAERKRRVSLDRNHRPIGEGLITVTSDASLAALAQMLQPQDGPVILVQEGVMVGVCDASDLVTALRRWGKG